MAPLKPYTVVLLRPDYLAAGEKGSFGQDVYVAHVSADGTYDAFDAAKLEAANADCVDASDGPEQAPDPEDYALVVLFGGHHEPKLFGWQI